MIQMQCICNLFVLLFWLSIANTNGCVLHYHLCRLLIKIYIYTSFYVQVVNNMFINQTRTKTSSPTRTRRFRRSAFGGGFLWRMKDIFNWLSGWKAFEVIQSNLPLLKFLYLPSSNIKPTACRRNKEGPTPRKAFHGDFSLAAFKVKYLRANYEFVSPSVRI